MIYAIGDSHSRFFSEHKEFLPYFKWIHFGPVCSRSLCRKYKNLHPDRIIKLLKDIPLKSKILFCFGEVDCRNHIYKQSKIIQKKSIHTVIELCVNDYFTMVDEIINLGYKISLWQVIPTTPANISERFDICGSDKERMKITKKFNVELKKECDKRKLIFLSIFDKLIDKNRSIKFEYYLKDKIHLGKKAVPLTMDKFKENNLFPLDNSPKSSIM